jgi:twitching motility protein PilT
MSLPDNPPGASAGLPFDEDYNLDDLLTDIMDLEATGNDNPKGAPSSVLAVQESPAAREPEAAKPQMPMQEARKPEAAKKPVYDDIEDFVEQEPGSKQKPVFDDIEDIEENTESDARSVLQEEMFFASAVGAGAAILQEASNPSAAAGSVSKGPEKSAAQVLEPDDDEDEGFESLEDLLDDEGDGEEETADAKGEDDIEFGEGNTIPFKEDYVIDDLLKLVFQTNASDLHFSAGAPPIIRLHGDLMPLAVPKLDAEKAKKLLMDILKPQQREKFCSTNRIDFTYEMGTMARFRTNIFHQYHGIAAAFRLIPHKIPTIDSLNLPQILKEIATSRSGIVIVTGPTGSGKSTTLASMIDFINENRNAHIITVEDPIEFFHTNKNCLIDHREVGEHANSFADAVRSALREDPDIILVGEMRDLETIYQAVKVAETGCLVYATLHTNNASKAVDRMIDVFPAKQQAQIRSMLAQSLRAVIAQQLIKKIGGKGRVAVLEILLAISGLGNLIREGKTNQIPNFINTGRSYGMQSIDLALLELVNNEVITLEAALEKCQDPNNLHQASGVIAAAENPA